MAFVVQQFTDTGVQLCAWVLIGVVAVELLVAIWAAVGPQHWFWRGLGLWGAVMVMAPIGAWQVLWVLVFTAAFIVGIVQLARGVERYGLRKSAASECSTGTRYRYSLADLLLLVFLICLWLPGLVAAARNTPNVNWLGLAAVAALWAGLAVLAAKLAFGPRRVRDAVLLAIGLPLGAVAFWKAPGPVNFWLYVFGGGTWFEESVLFVIFELQLVLVIVAVIRLVCAIRSDATSPAWRLFSTVMLTGIMGIAATGLGYGYADLLKRPPQVAKFELPGNQFDRIVEIAQRVYVINRANESMAEMRRSTAKVADANELSALYAELLPILASENAVIYDPEKNAKSKATQVMPFAQTVRSLCRSLEAESEWARSNRQPNVAGDYALACLGLSESLGRGGVAADALVSRAIEGPGYTQLAKVRGELSADKLREALAALARDAERREDVDTVRARELDFGERAVGFLARMENTLWKLKQRKSYWEQSLEDANLRHTVNNALVLAELAAQLFKRETGRGPDSLEELVPEYLPAVPIDAYSGQPLRCTVQPEGLLIYSVGRDGVDDGGRFTNYWSATTGYDYDLDSLTRK